MCEGFRFEKSGQSVGEEGVLEEKLHDTSNSKNNKNKIHELISVCRFHM